MTINCKGYSQGGVVEEADIILLVLGMGGHDKVKKETIPF